MITKQLFIAGTSTLVATMFIPIQLLRAQGASDSERLEKLERAVEQLQQRNAELEAEVKTLKEQRAIAAAPPAEGSSKAKVASEGKNYVEQSVPAEKSSATKWKLSTPITELEPYGDARLRYEYRGGETDDDSPLAKPGAGAAGHNDWQERERERYRLCLGLLRDTP